MYKEEWKEGFMIGTVPSLCAGAIPFINASLGTVEIAGHTMIGIPGGPYVVGSSTVEDSPPRWVWVSPFYISERVVSEIQYREVTGRPEVDDDLRDDRHTLDSYMEYSLKKGGRLPFEDWYRRAESSLVRRKRDQLHRPARITSYEDALEYLEKSGVGFDLPTPVQGEIAARGFPVSVPRFMQMKEGFGGYKPEFVEAFAADFLENFVLSRLGKIYTDPKSEEFQRLIRDGRDFFASFVYGTPSGSFPYRQVSVSEDKYFGPANSIGFRGIPFGIREFVKGWYTDTPQLFDGIDPVGPESGEFRITRGSSHFAKDPKQLQAAYNSIRFQGDGGEVGFRVAAPASVVKSYLSSHEEKSEISDEANAA